MKKDFKNHLIPMTDGAWETTKFIAEKNERSASGQVRHWINKGIEEYYANAAKEASYENDVA